MILKDLFNLGSIPSNGKEITEGENNSEGINEKK